jgi:hypothetical protein
MKKSDLIAALAEKKNLTEKKAAEIVDLIFKGFHYCPDIWSNKFSWLQDIGFSVL